MENKKQAQKHNRGAEKLRDERKKKEKKKKKFPEELAATNKKTKSYLVKRS